MEKWDRSEGRATFRFAEPRRCNNPTVTKRDTGRWLEYIQPTVNLSPLLKQPWRYEQRAVPAERAVDIIRRGEQKELGLIGN